jgi:hypothetical protein
LIRAFSFGFHNMSETEMMASKVWCS